MTPAAGQMRGARLGCFVAILAAVCVGHTSAVWKEQAKVTPEPAAHTYLTPTLPSAQAVKGALPEEAEAAITDEKEQVHFTP